MKITEIQEGIKRMYVDEIDIKRLKGEPGEDRSFVLAELLNTENDAKIEKILDVIRCEARFGWHIYYRGK